MNVNFKKITFLKKHKILFAYILFLHILIAVLITKTDLFSIIKEKLDILPSELTKHYKTMTAFHKRLDKNLKPGSVIFVGDSLTQGLAVSSVCNHSANFGIGGDTTAGVLVRLSDYESLKQASVIILNIGANDTKRREVKDILNNYQEILNVLPENIPIIVTAIFPFDGYAERLSKRNIMIKQVNQGLQNLIKEYQHILYFDITKKLSNESGDLKREFHMGDGVHLNKAGYQVWINELKSFLSQHKLLQDELLSEKK